MTTSRDEAFRHMAEVDRVALTLAGLWLYNKDTMDDADAHVLLTSANRLRTGVMDAMSQLKLLSPIDATDVPKMETPDD